MPDAENGTKATTAHYVVLCIYCEKHVNAEVVGAYNYWDNEIDDPLGYVLLSCPRCHQPILGQQMFAYTDEDHYEPSEPLVIYPQRHRKLSVDVPRTIRSSYNEAVTGYSAGTYTASAIMCRRALEALVAEKSGKKLTLANGLRHMQASGLIDASLLEWAEMLRKTGNIAAHEVGKSVSKGDAHDLIEFTHALIEYVFTYKQRFEEFKKRSQAAEIRRAARRREQAARSNEPDPEAPTSQP